MSDKITSKPKYKVIKSNNIDYNDNTKVLQPKIDGSSSIIELNYNKPNKIYSYRVSKKSGVNIDHSDQVPYFRDLKIPKLLDNTILRGELFGHINNKPMSAEYIGGLLNSGKEKSLEKQKQHGWLKPVVYDIIKYHDKNVENNPYGSKINLINKVKSAIPELPIIESAVTSEEKKKLVAEVKSGKHPDTKEGLIEWSLNSPGGNPGKLKFRDTHDVFIRSVFPAINKASGKEKNEAGGFEYSWSPKGKIVGTVGTGFTRDKRIDILKNPDKYIGEVARVKSQQKFSSGALRAPSFYSLDIEKNLDGIKQAAFINELNKIAGGIDSAEDDMSSWLGPNDDVGVRPVGGYTNNLNPIRPAPQSVIMAPYNSDEEDGQQ
jgi:hypothetical protein